jgi:hypothetical protein
MSPDRPSFVKPCGAYRCPQSPRCLRANGVAAHAFTPTLKGCPFFIDVRGIALLTRPTSAPQAQGA